MIMKDKSIEALVKLALKNNQDAFTELYNRTYKMVFSTITLDVKNLEEAENLVQETYLTAFKKLNTLENPQTFCGWVKIIATRKKLDYLRKYRDDLYIEEYKYENGEISRELHLECDTLSYEEKENSEIIREIINELPEKQQLTVSLYYCQDLNLKEIASLMDCSVATVASRLNYGKSKIKEKVLELEKKGLKLYGLSPVMYFVNLLMQNEEAVGNLDKESISALSLKMVEEHSSIIGTLQSWYESIFNFINNAINCFPMSKNIAVKMSAVVSAVAISVSGVAYNSQNNTVASVKSEKSNIQSDDDFKKGKQYEELRVVDTTQPHSGVEATTAEKNTDTTDAYIVKNTEQNPTPQRRDDSKETTKVKYVEYDDFEGFSKVIKPEKTISVPEVEEKYIPVESYNGKETSLKKIRIKLPENWVAEEHINYFDNLYKTYKASPVMDFNKKWWYYSDDEYSENSVINLPALSVDYYAFFYNKTAIEENKKDYDNVCEFTKIQRENGEEVTVKETARINRIKYCPMVIMGMDSESDVEDLFGEMLENKIICGKRPVVKYLGESGGIFYYAMSGYCLSSMESLDYVIKDWCMFDAVSGTVRIK